MFRNTVLVVGSGVPILVLLRHLLQWLECCEHSVPYTIQKSDIALENAVHWSWPDAIVRALAAEVLQLLHIYGVYASARRELETPP